MINFRWIGLMLMLVTGNVVAGSVAMVVNNWPPYAVKSLPGQGLAVELVATALKRKGYQVSVKFETWPRALEGLEIGIFDIVGTVWKTPEREAIMLFSAPYLTNHIKFLKMKNLDIQYDTLDDLSGYIIGIIKGYAYEDEFVNSKRHIKLPQNYLIQNLQLLVQGDIDLTVDDERTIVYEINQYMPRRMNDFEFLEKPLSSRGLHIGVSRQNPKAAVIVGDFNQEIERMRQDGTYQKILAKYAVNQ